MVAAQPVAGPTVRRLTALLFLGQSLSTAAFFAASTVGAIAGAALSGRDELAGLPSAIYVLGSAVAAYPAARLMERWGRRPGLVLGLALGVAGALLAGWSVLTHNFFTFLTGYGLTGLTRGFTDLARYAAAEIHPPAGRGRAISQVVLGGTVGAIAGPALAGQAGRAALGLGADELAGPWFASAALFLLGLALLGLFLRPDPRDLAAQVDVGDPDTADISGPLRPLRAILAQPTVQLAAVALIFGQLVMVMIMAITSLHMTHHGHSLPAVSAVITAHALGMFGPSLLSGRLADRYGRAAVIVAGAALLVAACLLAPLSQAAGMLALALFLLGLGWNFCYVAGAALLTDGITLAERGRVQGANDLAVGLVSALGSLQSGIFFAWIGFANLNWIGLGLALVPALLALRLLWARRQPVAAA